MAGRWLVPGMLLWVALGAAASGAGAQPAEMRCNQEPGNRFLWVEQGFCDLPPSGPDKAEGLVIWNHGISGTQEQWRYPPALVFRLLQTRGWDVLAIKRHNLGETDIQTSLRRTVERTLAEAKAQRMLGYRKVVLAGQSFGGYATLDAADTASDLYAAVAMSPGVHIGGASGTMDPSIIDRLLQGVKPGRVALVLPKDDALFGHKVRGPSADRILAKRNLAYLLFDETTELRGHGGGTGGRFALRYGMCLVEFLRAPTVPGGRFTCPSPADEWTVARELAMPARLPRVIEDSGALPAEIGPLAGLWYGLLGDTIVLFALVDEGGPKPRAMYRWFTGRAGGGVYDATPGDARVVLTLGNRATVTVTPTGEGLALAWAPADGARTLTTTLARAKNAP